MAVVDAEERPTPESRPPAGLTALIERFDPDVIDVPSGSARIRLAVDGEGEWDAVIDDGAIELQPAIERQPDALLSADWATWEEIARDVRGGMVAFREGRLSVRQNLHLGVGFLAATSAIADERRLRFESVRTRLGKISTLSAGEGDPVICVHGLGATKASFLPTVAALADHHRVIAMDLPGFGDSDKPLGAPYDAPYFARAIEALLDELEIERAHLIGNSMGGRVAIEMGLLRPERTGRMALLCPALAWLRSRRWRWLLQAPLPMLGLIQPAPRVITEPIVRNLVPGGKDGWSAAGVDEFLRSYLTPRGRVAFYEAARNIYLDEPHGEQGFWTRLAQMSPADPLHLGAPRSARPAGLQEARRAGTSRRSSPGARLRPRAAARGAEADARRDPGVLRLMTILIGHGGASAIAPANTIASFDAARRAGVDMIEFDVRPRGSRLLVAHLAPQARRRGCLSLDDALDHLAQPRFSGIGLNVDVKGRGCESAIVAMLRGHGLLERSLISSQSADIVETVRTVAANARTAISIGGYISRRANRWHPRAWRERLLHELAAGRFGDVMLHHKLVEAEIADAIGRLGRRLFAWTVDEPALFARITDLGVAGVATNDPARLRAPH